MTTVPSRACRTLEHLDFEKGTNIEYQGVRTALHNFLNLKEIACNNRDIFHQALMDPEAKNLTLPFKV